MYASVLEVCAVERSGIRTCKVRVVAVLLLNVFKNASIQFETCAIGMFPFPSTVSWRTKTSQFPALPCFTSVSIERLSNVLNFNFVSLFPIVLFLILPQFPATPSSNTVQICGISLFKSCVLLPLPLPLSEDSFHSRLVSETRSWEEIGLIKLRDFCACVFAL